MSKVQEPLTSEDVIYLKVGYTYPVSSSFGVTEPEQEFSSGFLISLAACLVLAMSLQQPSSSHFQERALSEILHDWFSLTNIKAQISPESGVDEPWQKQTVVLRWGGSVSMSGI